MSVESSRVITSLLSIHCARACDYITWGALSKHREVAKHGLKVSSPRFTARFLSVTLQSVQFQVCLTNGESFVAKPFVRQAILQFVLVCNNLLLFHRSCARRDKVERLYSLFFLSFHFESDKFYKYKWKSLRQEVLIYQ